MPIILCRHGATIKNIEGGIDDRSTPLHDIGVAQAAETGGRLLDFATANGIARVQPITSGYDRTNATCRAAMAAFANSGLDIMPVIEDDRIGEIKFKPRDVVPTPQMPGVFGRVIDGPALTEELALLASFNTDRLQNVDAATAILVFGHRTTHRLLAMTHLRRDIAWMETLPRMDNCELWQLENGEIKVLHPGYPTQRDQPDPRRDTLK